jgi:hypothetical protein
MREDWAKHQKSYWLAHARNRAFPLWQRVVWFAQANHLPNGHTPLGSGELAEGTALVDLSTGEVESIASKSSIAKAITAAVEAGLLAESSCSSCLVLPWGISGGNPQRGRSDTPCRQRHSTRVLSDSDNRVVES